MVIFWSICLLLTCVYTDYIMFCAELRYVSWSCKFKAKITLAMGRFVKQESGSQEQKNSYHHNSHHNCLLPSRKLVIWGLGLWSPHCFLLQILSDNSKARYLKQAYKTAQSSRKITSNLLLPSECQVYACNQQNSNLHLKIKL